MLKKIKYATASLHKQRQGLTKAHDGEQFDKKKRKKKENDFMILQDVTKKIFNKI